LRRLHAFSVDLEDWYHPELVVRAGGAASAQPRIEQATRSILSLLGKNRQRATFFVLGDLARGHPELIREIHDAGHEIACHGMSHKPLWEHDPKSFARELKQFDGVLRDVLPGAGAKGYRAPTFSLDSSTAWALDVLADHGYEYDSSIFPINNRLYGLSGAPLGIYRPASADLRRHDGNGKIVEFPPTVLAVGPVRIPIGGGAYFRFLPAALWLMALRVVESNRPAMIYVHPWECDPLTPRLPLRFYPKLVTYFGIKGALDKLGRLMKEFRFSRIDEVLGIEQS